MERILAGKLIDGSFGNVPEVHSRRMAAIRGRGNRSTETRFRAMLIRAGIRGWKVHPETIPGKPDFYFPSEHVAVFLDGCFWHGCPRCGHVPRVNRPYWKAKIERNRQRDRDTNRQLLRAAIRAVRFWEHELRDCPKECIEQLRADLR